MRGGDDLYMMALTIWEGGRGWWVESCWDLVALALSGWHVWWCI